LGPGLAAVLLLLLLAACGGPPPERRVLILGFDGLDFALTRELMQQGRLPNLSQVARQGSFEALGTSIPPQSPVAWSTFITGLDPGGHGIFDFIHRDPATMAPYLSTTRTTPARTIAFGGWQLPLSAASVESLRQGAPFWGALAEEGVETTIIRMPANFPPSGTATRELSGMGTPDLLGTYGQFSFFTSAPGAVRRDVGGGTVYTADAGGGMLEGVLEGPPQPYRTSEEPMQAAFVAYVDATRRFVMIVLQGETRLILEVGQWSDWVPVTFDVQPWQSAQAQCRFYLRQIEPHLELYVSPLNLDPFAPALPISSPSDYATELAEATGRFYTQGMPEETNALKAGLLSTDEFLRQARDAQDEAGRQFRHVLERFDRGLLFYYFGSADQVSHMLWRSRDPGHPAYDPDEDFQYAGVIEDLYVEFDGIVGEALGALGPDDLLVVMSDHGFASWRRSFNLNSWLRSEGYATPADGSRGPALGDVDLSRSRAYGLGLNGLYANIRGREVYGIVDPAEREALLDEMSAKLLAIIDPATGEPAVSRVSRREQAYASVETASIAPDLIIGYAKGTRVSDESALGRMSPGVFANNMSAWSGDHCMDPAAVPGILLTNRVLRSQPTTLQQLAPAILGELGVEFP
jgi:predicted AlkP superfamily phosphohydrolase/phosphomutase